MSGRMHLEINEAPVYFLYICSFVVHCVVVSSFAVYILCYIVSAVMLEIFCYLTESSV